MSKYWNLTTVVDDNTNLMGNGDLDYEEYGQIAVLLNNYVRKEKGKGLSSNNFTDEYCEKLDNIEDGAQVNVLETISINEGEPIHADENKNININIAIPTKTSELENDSDFAVTSEDTTFSENLNVEKNLSVDDDLSVNGDTTLHDTQVSGDLSVSNDLSVTNDTNLHNTNINGTLNVTRATSLKNTEIDGVTTISGNTTIHGDLWVDGVTHTTTEEQINTSADTIVLRQNNPTTLGSTYAGIIINKYNGTEELALVTDSDGTLRLGTGNGSDTLYTDIYWDDETEKWYSDSELTVEVEPSGSLTSWQSIETIGDVKHYTNAVFTVINFIGIVPIMCRDEDIDMDNNALLKWNSANRVSKTINNPTTNGEILSWKITSSIVYTDGENFYNVDGTSITQPSGTSGATSTIGNFVYYNNAWYSKDTDWYLVNNFIDNSEWTIVSDQETIDALELETPIAITQVTYNVGDYDWESVTDSVTDGSMLPITSNAVYDAINALDVSSVGGNGKYIKSISQADGKIVAVEETIDTAMSDSSTNTVQNKVIKSYVDNNTTKDTAMSDSSTNAVQNKVIKSYVDTNVTNAITQVLNTNY